ncbi:hypothetical protein SAMN05421678_11432 [Actinopolymorpha cephalotaxi]|uniref:Uncharacterized protein n=1 Tax=Actinopolymorpha cephalotaxi TaxID=504797 RepID=A0A1I2YDQ9_9ACTN|nr:hypothetical protein [Actinopolymorpha cephalotaxi]NYH87032.1 hypothetical protein [Actinopolymorpha cephalotaxi]SFH23499.1 hypothetical protein SAMN05421678_11432 [Actinopolymorpha cephalotaxi]
MAMNGATLATLKVVGAIVVGFATVTGAVAAAVFSWLAYQDSHAAVEAVRPSVGAFTARPRDPLTGCVYRAPYEGISVAGTAHMERHESLFLLVRGDESVFWIAGTPIDIDSDGRWTQATGTLGQSADKDSNGKYHLLLVAADYNGASQLETAYEKPGVGYVKTLSPSIHVMDEACVLRN